MMKPQHLLVNRNLVERMLDNRLYISYTLERKKVGCLTATVSKTNAQKTLGARSSHFSHISLMFLEKQLWTTWRIPATLWLSQRRHGRRLFLSDGFPHGQWTLVSLHFPVWVEVGLEGKGRVRKSLLPTHQLPRFSYHRMKEEVLVSGSVVSFFEDKSLVKTSLWSI